MKNRIKYLVMDVDGTLTDGKIYIGLNGEEVKVFNIKDGCGIHDILPKCGIVPVIITGRFSKMLEIRCNELGIKELHQSVKDKLAKLKEVIGSESLLDVSYIGDDINDLGCMLQVKADGGVVGCPCDAVPDVHAIADFISSKKGGDGAVREFIDWLYLNSFEAFDCNE